MASQTDIVTLQCEELLGELAPRLETARKIEREHDRNLACRFNVFAYVRTDELGLSRVIADLLDPMSEHGQGTTFLKALLETFTSTPGSLLPSLIDVDAKSIVVQTERVTDTGGRIDITVDIPDGARSFCLAFENKPYASQDSCQVTAYLRFLSKHYQGNFLLVYLPPSGEGPYEKDLPRADRELWVNHFLVMPYDGENSLADWFATCRERCKAERVRAFLKDAEMFCKEVFGETAMTIDRETQTVADHLYKYPRHLRTALTVHDAWHWMRAEVCEEFLHHLRRVVEDRMRAKLSKIASDFHVGCVYEGDKPTSNNLWITREDWPEWDETEGHDVRTMIRLRSEGRGPNGWIWGVSNPKKPEDMSDVERARRIRLNKALKDQGLRLDHDGIWWPQYEYAKRYGDWYPLVPDLHEEFKSGCGPIVTYFAENLIEIAKTAIPAIDEVEGQDRG